MLRYAITNRAMYPGNEEQKQAELVQEAARWAVEGIDLILLREKDLKACNLAALARQILQTIARLQSGTRLLISSRLDVAIATGAHGVHLTSSVEELTCSQVRALYRLRGLSPPVITVSCHSLQEVQRARQDGTSAILFAPVFGKPIDDEVVVPGLGVEQLRIVCAAASPVPVLALGGVDTTNSAACLDAGAAGIAGIRLFHKD
jgi:thiamine-phosphate pyrophosphorylase